MKNIPIFLAQDKEDDYSPSVLRVKTPQEDQKTLSLTSASAGHGGETGDGGSTMGTSTALDMQATTDEMLFDKIVHMVKSTLMAY